MHDRPRLVTTHHIEDSAPVAKISDLKGDGDLALEARREIIQHDDIDAVCLQAPHSVAAYISSTACNQDRP
jgi:hypothetical protein